MSYCRFGPDSDVYVYMAWNGIAVHVANRRAKPGADIAEVMSNTDPKDFVTVFEGLYEPINLAAADQDRYGLTPQEAIDFLVELSAAGIKVPVCAFRRLEEEME